MPVLPLMCLTFVIVICQLVVMNTELTILHLTKYLKFDFNLLLNLAVLSILQTYRVPVLLAFMMCLLL